MASALALATFGAVHWKLSGADVSFQWLQQLGLWCKLSTEEAAQKERIQKNTAILRVSNYILFSHIFVHLAAWKTMWVAVGFLHSPQLMTLVLMLIHIGLYVQHLLVVKHYIQPTSRQVRVLSAVVYMAYAAGYFVASTLQDGPGTFPNYACTISEKYLLATRFFLVMAFIDTKLSVICQLFFSLTVLGTSWYHGRDLGFVQVTEECEIYGCLVAFVLMIDVMMQKRVQACLQSADAEWMVSSFRRMLRGVCDCEFLLDHNLKIQGNPECLQHMLMTDEKLQGIEFTKLLADQQDAFRKFVEMTASQNIKSPTDVQAASCMRVSLATKRCQRSADLFHVSVPQPLGEPYHLLAVREDSETPVTEPFEAAWEEPRAAKNQRTALMSPMNSERKGTKGGAETDSSMSTQPEAGHGAPVKEILEMMLLVDADSERLNVEQLQISFSNCDSQKVIPSLQNMVVRKDWQKLQSCLRTFAERPGAAAEAVKAFRLHLPWNDGMCTTAAHVEISHFRRPAGTGQKLCLHLKDFLT